MGHRSVSGSYKWSNRAATSDHPGWSGLSKRCAVLPHQHDHPAAPTARVPLARQVATGGMARGTFIQWGVNEGSWIQSILRIQAPEFIEMD